MGICNSYRWRKGVENEAWGVQGFDLASCLVSDSSEQGSNGEAQDGERRKAACTAARGMWARAAVR